MLIQTAYACFFSKHIRQVFRNGNASGITDMPPLSVIICARNEADNLERNLPDILRQRYCNEAGKPNYEVIVVNDRSSDGSASVLDRLSVTFTHLKVLHLTEAAPGHLPGKKYALARGAEQAAHELIICTDADCRPASDDWLRLMQAPFADGASAAAGYGGYERQPGLLNAFIRWETMHTFLQYAACAKAGIPYMAVGRNLAYRSRLLHTAMQRPEWSLLPSGDDDLLVSSLRSGERLAVVADPAAFTVSPPKRSWKEWVRQKQRHLSTGKYYPLKVRMLLGAYSFSHAGIWLLAPFACAAGGSMAVIAPALLLVRGLLYWRIWSFVARRLGVRDIGILFPVFDIGWMIYNFAFAPWILWKNKQTWN